MNKTLILICLTSLMLFIPSFVDSSMNFREMSYIEERTHKISFFKGEWNHTYGGKNFDIAYSVDITSDGGYILVGATTMYSSDEFNEDVWLIKTDEYGNKIWDKTFGGDDSDQGLCVHETSDGGFIIVGGTYSYSHSIPHDEDILLIKTDRNGNLVWEKVIGSDMGEDEGWCVKQTTDGGYIITGQTSSYSYSDDVWLIKTDEYGNVLWNRTFNGGSFDIGDYVIQTSDGGYIITGNTDKDDGGLWVIKTDNNGDIEWDRVFGSGSDWGHCIQETSDGCYIVVGYTSHYGAGSEDVWLIKIDREGNEVWNHTYGGNSFDYAHCVRETSDGGFIIMGNTVSLSHGDSDFWFIKTDKDGNKEWGRILGGVGDDVGYCIQETRDDGFVAVGRTDSYGAGKEDIWLVKIIPDNLSPSKPVISGPSNGRIYKPYKYSIVSTDPEGDDIYYFILWGDSISRWIGPYKSGINATVSHTWSSQGTYEIKVKVIDKYGWEGPWGDPLPVTMPKPFWLNLLPPFLQKILLLYQN